MPSEPQDDAGQDEDEDDEKDDAEQLPDDGESPETEHEEAIKPEYDEETKKIIEGWLLAGINKSQVITVSGSNDDDCFCRGQYCPNRI